MRAWTRIVVVLATAAGAWPVADAGAAFPGDNGPIVFYGQVGTTYGLWRVDPVGGSPSALSSPGVSVKALRTAADGMTVGYSAPNAGAPNFWTSKTDGSAATRSGLSVQSAGGNSFTWFTPAGRVVHVPPVTSNQILHEANLDGSQDITLTADDALRERPVVSPDGLSVYYARQDKPGTGPKQIYKRPLAAAGSETPVVTSGTTAPFDISPDGKKLLYGTFDVGARSMRLLDLGTGIDTPVASGLFLDGAHFSPDGSQVVYTAPDFTSIHIVKPDGTGDREVAVTGLGTYVGSVTWAAEPHNDDVVVTVTGDQANDSGSRADDLCDVDTGQAGAQCTLRAAIELANDRGGARITFNIPGGGVPRIQTVAPATGNAGITPITTPIEIDATTQPGGWVELVGPGGNEPLQGILVQAGGSGSEVRGLVVHGFPAGEVVVKANLTTIEGNRIGTDVTGTQARGQMLAFGYGGVAVLGDDNLVSGNVIAGEVNMDQDNAEGGSLVFVSGDRNRLEGNRIGVGADGHVVPLPALTTALDAYVGVVVMGFDNVVGHQASSVPATCATPCNLIAGVHVPVAVGDDPRGAVGDATADNVVSGNWIGLESDGTPVFIPGGGGTTGIGDWAAGTRTDVIANLVHAEHGAISLNDVGYIHANRAYGRAEGVNSGFAANLALVEAGDHSEVTGNVIRSYSGRGLVLDDGDTTVTQNSITDNPLGGILVRSGTGHVITDNELTDNKLLGIGVLPFEDPVPMAVLARNEISGSDIGIDLFPYTGSVVDVPPWGRAFPGDGVTLNDVDDTDDGPNGYLNFPEILSAASDGGALDVRGFVEAPSLAGGDYLIEAFTSPACAGGSASSLGGLGYGAGAHYVGVGGSTSSGGYADFNLNLTGVPSGDRVVSLTATRLDEGATSEFSRCVPLAGTSEVAHTDVGAGQTGTVLDDQQATVTIPDAAGRHRAGGNAHGAGTLYLTRYAGVPSGTAFTGASATGPDGSQVTPGALAARSWLLTDRSLTTAGGAAAGKAAALDVCLDAGDVVNPAELSHVVVVRRSPATQGNWQPHTTTLISRSGRPYLCTAGLTALGEFGIAGAASAFTLPDPAPGPAPGPSPPAGGSPAAVPRKVASLKSIAARAKAPKGTAQLRITCSAVAPCKGTLRLTTKIGRKTVTIGKASFTIPAGSTRTVNVKLGKSAAKALKRGALKVRAIATVGKASLTRTVTITRP